MSGLQRGEGGGRETQGGGRVLEPSGVVLKSPHGPHSFLQGVSSVRSGLALPSPHVLVIPLDLEPGMNRMNE